ncbi:MAG: hypothetical protein Q9227_008815 [Pyrenula ochraceoflavens]
MSEKAVQNEGLSWAARFFRLLRVPKYQRGKYAVITNEAEEGLLPHDPDSPLPEVEMVRPSGGYWGWLKAVSMLRYPLYISIIIHTLILIDLIYAHWIGRVSYGQYGNGFHTDFESAKGVLNLEKVRFTHSLRSDGNGTIMAHYRDDGPRYVGVPNLELDRNWEDLVGGRYIRLEDHEVEKLNKDDAEVADLTQVRASPGVADVSGFYGSVDMVHNLHCLNTIRKQFDPEYYETHLDASMKHSHRMKMRMHVDHCIDQIRQAILCHADLTPVTLRPVTMDDPSADLVGETERQHTCRDWRAVRKWLTERGKNNMSLPPKYRPEVRVHGHNSGAEHQQGGGDSHTD